MSVSELGTPVPPNVAHAISVSFPTWQDNVGYEEGDKRVVSKLLSAYPRFVASPELSFPSRLIRALTTRFLIHFIIKSFADAIVESYGNLNHPQALLFPSSMAAQKCVDFILSKDAGISPDHLKTINLVLDHNKTSSELLKQISPSVCAILLPGQIFPSAKEFWQHTGEGISSRYAELCHHLFNEGILVEEHTLRSSPQVIQKTCKGAECCQKASMSSLTTELLPNQKLKKKKSNEIASGLGFEPREGSVFLEENFDHKIDISFASIAKSAIRRRITEILMGEHDHTEAENPKNIPNSRRLIALSEDDVFLWSCGMSAIYHTHRKMMEVRGALKSITFGFPYVDTLKVLQKFGPGCVFYGMGSEEDLDHLEERLKAGEKYLALFCEFPANPLMKSPNLLRIRELADTYDFAVVVDETIGNFFNVHVLPYADIVVSSLTKVFSGECNVMGGCSILNPNGRYYKIFKEAVNRDFEDNYWVEDAIIMERNSRDVVKRIIKINQNAEAICNVLRACPIIKDVHYPKFNLSKKNYDACRTPNGGYGGLISFTFQRKEQAINFYDQVKTAKGPSLGTNFTLTSPYVILAHYTELDWAAQYGLQADLIRVSIGIEDRDDLVSRFEDALKFTEQMDS